MLFIAVGQQVKLGDMLFIVEVMKVEVMKIMNEMRV